MGMPGAKQDDEVIGVDTQHIPLDGPFQNAGSATGHVPLVRGPSTRRSWFAWVRASALALACSCAPPAPPAQPVAASAASATSPGPAEPPAPPPPSPAPPVSASARVSAPPPRPAISDDDLLHAEASPANGSARLALGGGVELIVVVRAGASTEQEPLLAMALVEKGKVLSRRDGLRALAGAALDKLGDRPCDVWSAGAQREALGTGEAVRVSLVCSMGADYQSSTELAVLLRPGAPAPRDLAALAPIWAGLADATQSAMDSCATSRAVTFKLVGDKALEQTITEETSWTDQHLAPDLTKRLRRDCKVGKKKRVERVTLP